MGSACASCSSYLYPLPLPWHTDYCNTRIVHRLLTPLTHSTTQPIISYSLLGSLTHSSLTLLIHSTFTPFSHSLLTPLTYSAIHSLLTPFSNSPLTSRTYSSLTTDLSVIHATDYSFTYPAADSNTTRSAYSLSIRTPRTPLTYS